VLLKRQVNLKYIGWKIRDHKDDDIKLIKKNVDEGNYEFLQDYDFSDINRAAIRMAFDQPELLKKYLSDPPKKSQTELFDFLTSIG
jgi:hypothetical protein